MTTFLLEFWTEDDDFHIYAEADEYEKEITLTGQAEEIVSHFDTIYEIVEEKKEGKEQKLRQSIESISAQLITPFAKQIQECSLVRFIVYEDLIRCAFDLLFHDNSPLFLQREICYQVAEGEGEDEPQIELTSALLIADLTADPEEACRQVAELIDESEYAEMENADLDMIKQAADQVDVLVVSAHGEIDEDNSGGVTINDETISPKLVGKLEAWIVYFDSCQQGANMDYIQSFQDNSEIQFYLAPIISNDAGDSSTLTMVWFFTAVLKHGNPILALHETRKRLFEFYTAKKKLSLITSLNKAFAFRLYEFVESSDE